MQIALPLPDRQYLRACNQAKGGAEDDEITPRDGAASFK
jgi:hypothetical protein